MIFLIISVLLAASIWGIMATLRRFNRLQLGRNWWIAFVALSGTGLTLGIWLAFYSDYQVSPQMRLAGFPIPIAFFHLENGQWVDYVTPPHIAYPGLFTNVVAVVTLALMPLLLTSFVVKKRSTPG